MGSARRRWWGDHPPGRSWRARRRQHWRRQALRGRYPSWPFLVLASVLVLSAVAASDDGTGRAGLGRWLPRVLGLLGLLAVGAPTTGAYLARLREYEQGWRDGRAEVLAALAEARRRGLTTEQWWAGELERDRAQLADRLGLSPPDPDLRAAPGETSVGDDGEQ